MLCSMTRPDIAEGSDGKSAFVIRVEPRGLPQGVGGFSSSVTVATMALRWIKRNHAYVVRVRHRRDDPLGGVIHEEMWPSSGEAFARAERLSEEIRAGRAPWRS